MKKYFLEDDLGLNLYDFTDPNDIKRKDKFYLSGEVRQIKVKDNIAYVADQKKGLILVDVWIKDDIAYLAASGKIHIINIKNPAEPELIKKVDLDCAIYDMCMIDDYLFIHLLDNCLIFVYNMINEK